MNASEVPPTPEFAQRLADAEATIIALRGEIDAVAVSELQVSRAQEALRASESALRRERDRAQRYLDTAAVILIAGDIEGRVTLVNRYACSILGWRAEELIGHDFIEMCVPARLRSETRALLRDVHGGDDSKIDNLIVTKSGEERLIEWRPSLVRDDKGAVIGFFSSGTDITDRSQAAEALRIAEESMRFALEAAGVGIWDMDYTTGEHRWSETLEAHYGLKPGTFNGTFDAFAEVIHPEDRASVLEIIGKAVTSGGDFAMQNRSIWPDGTVRWLSGSGRVLLGDHGEPVRAVGITLDVTERRTLEEQYQQSQKMEAVGRLAGGVAHDFNNLLMVITGYTDLLLHGLLASDARRQDLEQIRNAADAAAALTRQLLAFSRRQVIEPTMVVLENVVAAASKMLTRLIGEDVELVTRLNSTTATVHVDPGQLEQVIMNLAVNARDAMPTGGTLTLETTIVELTEKDARTHWPASSGRFALLAVSDTGIGMDATTRGRIFEPFFTTKEQGKGTGLGLAMAYGIVKQGGGFIEVNSEPGRGSTFKIYLPVFADEPAELNDAEVKITPAGHETILIVEDSDGVRDITHRVLARQGYRVIEAPSAAAALDIARSFDGDIDLLLTDVVMPEMSGRVLAERFAQYHPKARLLFMSGYTDDAVVRHGVLSAEMPYLQKPFSPRTLASRVRQVLDATLPQQRVMLVRA